MPLLSVNKTKLDQPRLAIEASVTVVKMIPVAPELRVLILFIEVPVKAPLN